MTGSFSLVELNASGRDERWFPVFTDGLRGSVQ